MTGLDNIFTKSVLLVSSLLLVVGCAKQIAPTGGAKDETPPKILSSHPLNGSTNFSEKKIELSFDEYVVTSSLTKELIVSPPLANDPTVKMKGKKVEISWKDTLAENATYLFQFGEGIKDLNEGNALDSNVFVFSTGDVIDSLSKHGKVVDAYSLKPVPDVYVMLYKKDIDSLPKTRVPDYYTKTDDQGLFEFQYLAQGDYKAFALQPINKGYKYDLASELIAFSDTLVKSEFLADSLEPDYESLIFKLFRKNDTTQFLKKTGQIENKGLFLSFNKPVSELTINALDGRDVLSWKETWDLENDSVVYWLPKAEDYDSLKFEVIFDANKDTVFFRKPQKPAAAGKARKNAAPTSLAIEKGFGNNLILGFDAHLTTQTPIDSIALDSVMLYHNQDTIYFKEYLSKETFGFKMNYTFIEGESYDLYFPKGSIADLYGLKNDSLHIKFSVLKDADLGEIVVNHQLPKDINYVWQLLDKDGKWVEAFNVSQSGTVTHKNLPAGNYQIRLIFDENGNQRWDSGDYEQKQQPERIMFHDPMIEVRANWISEIDWIVEN